MVKAAKNLAKSGPHASPLPPELDRSRLIRTLSVFVSQLESISGPGEPNYDICIQASKAISRTLDELLNPSLAYLGPASTGTSTAQFADLDNVDLGTIGADAVNGNFWDGFDVSNWANSVDWTATYGEWSMS